MNGQENQSADYLKESLRLAELHLEGQNMDLAIQERRAVLIITLGIVAIGYLLAFTGLTFTENIAGLIKYIITSRFEGTPGADESWLAVVILIVLLLPVGILIIAVVDSTHFFRPLELGARGGASRDYSMNTDVGGNLNCLREIQLQDYKRKIEDNQKLLDEKSKILKHAQRYLIIGLSLVAIFVGVQVAVQVIQVIQEATIL